jgi:hypothetical protein
MHPEAPSPPPTYLDMKTLYQDSLIAITDDEIVFYHYYFPFGGNKQVPFSQIESVEARPPSIAFGSWRIWGGGPRTWFPFDGARPKRDTIFVAFLRGRFGRIGFTVEDSQPVKSILKERGLLRESLPV